MPRVPRAVVPDYPHHVVHRGHNRQAIFAERDDYERYLGAIRELKVEHQVAVNAYCLMTNHVHLLLTPRDSHGLANFMKELAGPHSQRHNLFEGRSGSLWEGRYRSSVVDHDGYLLACSRYIELNPVRARIVAEPEEYAWSSCGDRLGVACSGLLDLDPAYRALAPSEEDRRRIYQGFLQAAVPKGEWELIRRSVRRGYLTGNDRFVDEVAAIIGRRVERRGRGRPRKSDPSKNGV